MVQVDELARGVLHYGGPYGSGPRVVETTHKCYCMRGFYHRDEEGVKYYLPVPGYTKDKVSARWADEQIVITLAELDAKENPWVCKTCTREYSIPLSSDEVDLKKVSITVSDGMLRLVAPFRKEKAPFEFEVK